MRICFAVFGVALAACSGAQPIGYAPAPVVPAVHGRSWIAPDLTGKTLLYVSDEDTVDVYDYGTNTKVGSLADFSHAAGSCTDGAGNVYVTNTGSADVLKFSHGGTKPTYIIDPSPYPVDCAIDTASGNLAVINEYGASEYSKGDVAIYAGGKGKPKIYKSSFSVPLTSGAYDAHGNLLVSAFANTTFDFGYLPAGQQKFESVNLRYSSNWYGPPYVRWDGEYFVAGFRAGYVDEPDIFAMYTIKGTNVIREGYSLAERVGQSSSFWLGKVGGPKSLHRANRLLLNGSYDYGGILFYYYPEGGAAVFAMQDELESSGVTVSPPG
ncbi:MAG TPA: hypothetical protein VIX83_00220 [Candidatus Cybelea sp.]